MYASHFKFIDICTRYASFIWCRPFFSRFCHLYSFDLTEPNSHLERCQKCISIEALWCEKKKRNSVFFEKLHRKKYTQQFLLRVVCFMCRCVALCTSDDDEEGKKRATKEKNIRQNVNENSKIHVFLFHFPPEFIYMRFDFGHFGWFNLLFFCVHTAKHTNNWKKIT